MAAIQQLLASLKISGGGGGGTLFDEIMADSPFVYLRLGEASGTNANNEAGATDGTYSGAGGPSLGNTALYTGGPTSIAIVGSDDRVHWPGASVPAMASMSIVVVYRPTFIASIRHLVTIDQDSGGTRKFQWRLNGTNMEFVKIVGGVDVPARAHGMTAGVSYILHVTVSTSGTVRMYVNGSQIGTDATIAAADYGSAPLTPLVVGNRGGPSISNEASPGDRYSEAAVFASELSAARVLAHAEAAGFA